MGGGVLGQSEIEPCGSVAVAPLEQAAGGDRGGVLVARGELMVVVKAAIR